jgi:class 3 adenylate cyclase/CHASE2 domain-containing sensor protein
MTSWIRDWIRRHPTGLAQAIPLAIAVASALLSVLFTIDLDPTRSDQYVDDLEIALWSPPQAPDQRIIVLTFDEKTVSRFTYRSPIDRGYVADLLDYLGTKHVRAIGLDLLFDQRTEASKDRKLQTALSKLKVPIVVSWTDNASAYGDQFLAHTEYLNRFISDSHGAGGGPIRGYVDLKENNRDVVSEISPDHGDVASFPHALAIAAGGREADTKVSPGTLIAWRGDPAGSSLHVSDDTPAFKVYPASVRYLELLQHLGVGLRDKIVLVGTDLALLDTHGTPFDVVDAHQVKMAGVKIWAYELSQLLDHRKAPEVGWPTNLLIAFLMAALGAILGAIDISVPKRVSFSVASVLGLWAVGVLFFHFGGVLISLVAPSMAFALSLWGTESVTGSEAREQRAFIKGAFGRYVSPKIVDIILAQPGAIELGGTRRKMTFLFCDIEGFTAWSESTDPHRLGEVLNAYFDGITQCVHKHDGTLDKFIGDAVFAIFNAPTDLADHETCAVKCALDIDKFATRFSMEQRAKGHAFGRTRIGVHTGEAVVGNFGSKTRFNYTAQGDAVNLASRLEGANKQFGTRILVSGATRAACLGIVFRKVASVLVTGKTERIDVWEPLGIEDPRRDSVTRYEKAYDELKKENGLARAFFGELAREDVNDPLVRYHLARLTQGEAGELVRLSEK